MPVLPIPRDPSPSQPPSHSFRSLISHLVPRQLTSTSSLSSATSNAFSQRANLHRRADTSVQQGIIPTYYNFSGPAAGTVVGIVLGSVAGFLLLVWLISALTGQGSGANIQGEEEIVVRRPRSPRSRRSTRRSTRSEVRQVSRSPRRERIIVEERRDMPPPQRTRSIIVEERQRVPGDDVVEVIEEHDEYRRPRRNSGRSARGYRY